MSARGVESAAHGLAWIVSLGFLASAGGCQSGNPSAAEASTERVIVRWNAAAARVEVVGLPPATVDALTAAHLDADAWRRILAVNIVDSDSLAPGDASAPTAMLGKYAIEHGVLVFTPRFPLRPGLEYRATFDPVALPSATETAGDKIECAFALPVLAAGPPTAVVAVFPSGDRLPANLLKFYLHFSAPMSRGESYRHVRLVDDADRPVPDAFLEIGEELWNRDFTRLTLLFDPGRIKRGVKPNEDVGAPLVEGRSYTLVIDAEWRDARGQPLAAAYRKEFRVTAPDYEQPDPHAWRFSALAPGATDSLVVEFNEPLDRALAEHLITIRKAAGPPLAGESTVDEGETRWTFQPERAWAAGDYVLHVAADLEDRAGNSVGRPFEREDASSDSAIPEASDLDIPFTIAAP